MDRGWRLGAVVVTAIALPGLLGASQARASISRSAATSIALRVLKPSRALGPTVVFSLPRPVAAGTSVVEAAPGTRIRSRPLRRAAWLFWEDKDYESLFEHPSTLLLVDARSGRIVRRQAMGWFPLLGGRRPKFLSSPAGYHDRHSWVFSKNLPGRPRSRARGASPRAGAGATPAIRPGELRHDCLIMLGDREDPILSGSFAAMLDWAKHVGVTAYPDQATDVPSLRTTLNLAFGRDCDDVVLFIAGHGMPPPGWVDPESGAALEGGPAGLSLNLSASRTGLVPNKMLTPEDIRRVISDYPTIDFKVEIESCFAGRWEDELGGTAATFAPNLIDLGLSSAADQTSKGQITLTKLDDHGRVLQTGIPATDNPWHAGEFTNGISHGLALWATDPNRITLTHGDLGAGVDAAAQLGLKYNAAASLPSSVLKAAEHADPIFRHRAHHFRVKLRASEVNGGFSVSGWTHGRFDSVTVTAPADDTITSFDAHGRRCVAVDESGTEYPPDSTGLITIPAPHRWVAVRCQRKPTDDDVDIAVALASGSAHGKTVAATVSGGSEAFNNRPLSVRP